MIATLIVIIMVIIIIKKIIIIRRSSRRSQTFAQRVHSESANLRQGHGSPL